MKGSKGILTGLKENSKEYKNKDVNKSTEPRIKRTYSLKQSTVIALNKLQALDYPLGTDLSDIVEEAILKLYKEKYPEVE